MKYRVRTQPVIKKDKTDGRKNKKADNTIYRIMDKRTIIAVFEIKNFHVLIINCIASNGKLVGGSVFSFTDKLDVQDKEDICNAVLLAQLGADKTRQRRWRRCNNGKKVVQIYMLVLEHLGFIKEDIVFTEYKDVSVINCNGRCCT